jgi:GT2 family glycosyltransferase
VTSSVGRSDAPSVTVSLVTWNGMRWLPGCLASLEAQTLDDFELLILDNGSTDGSVAWLRDRVAGDPRIQLTEWRVNRGFARAHDQHILAARGEAVLLLNQDVELDPGFLAATFAVLRDRPDTAAVQGRLRRLRPDGERTDSLDTTGLLMRRDRRAVSRGQLEPDPEGSIWRTPGPVWGADGAAPVYRRSALMAARLPRSDGAGFEVLDEDFFAYKEDVDLAWRLRRLGWQAWYEPTALGWHARGSGDTGAQGWREVARANLSNPPRVRAMSWRNQRLMQVKNEELAPFLRDFAWIARREFASWGFILFADPRRISAVPGLVRALPAAWRKRRAISGAARTLRPGRAVEHPFGAVEERPAAILASRLRSTSLSRALGHLRRRGARSTVRRSFTELEELAWTALRRPRLHGVHPVHPRKIQARLYRPRFREPTGADTLIVTGWVHAAIGIEAVDLYLDGKPSRAASLGRARPDASTTWRHLGGAEIDGFDAVLPLAGVPPGDHLLAATVQDRAGNVRILTRRFRRLDPTTAYDHYHARSARRSRHAWLTRRRGARRDLGSVLVVVVADPGPQLVRTLGSLRSQTLQGWECVVLSPPHVEDRVRELVRDVTGEASNARWSVVTDAASTLPAESDAQRLVGFLLDGDVLDPSALAELAEAGADRRVGIVYCDHDAIDADGRHVDPWFVPDWSPYRLLAQDYVRGAFLVRDSEAVRACLADLGRPGGRVDGRYALLLAASETTERVVHVPRVLWSRPAERPGTDGDSEASAAAAALARRGERGATVSWDEGASGPIRQIAWPAAPPGTSVSVVIPTTGRPELVAGTLRLLHEQTTFPDVEVIFLDNSRGRHPAGIAMLHDAGEIVLERDEPFNWARLSNAGARRASGDLLLFLNDDLEAVDPAWLDELVRLVSRSDVGAAGPLLLYPDGMIQHAGVITVGIGGGAAHLLQGLDPNDDLYLDLHRLLRETSAVTGACLLVSRADFEKLGGFDEELVVSGNDVDFCLRLVSSGRPVLWTPRSVLIHHEGRSRRNVAYLADEVRFWARWSARLQAGDPYFNPNLARDRVDCDLDWSRVG